MTTLPGPGSAERTYPLSPFQRSALAYPRRPLAVTVEIATTAGDLAESTESALASSPELTATLRTVPGLRIPRQTPSPPVLERGRGWRLTAGSLSVLAEPRGSGTRLTVQADALVADAHSVELLLGRIAAPGRHVSSMSFFDAATGHAAMAAEGELDQERRYWQSVPRAGDARAALGSACGSSGRRVTVSVPMAAAAAAALAKLAVAQGVDIGDVLYLALHLLADRACPSGTSLGRLVDARGLMGLDSVSGPFTQVVPDAADVDPSAPARAMLIRQVERLRLHTEMAGGAALPDGGAVPTVIFDPRMSWTLPNGWRLMDAFEGRAGALLLRSLRDGTGLRLIADACDGDDPGPLRTILLAWADVAAAVARDPDVGWSSLNLGIRDDRDGSYQKLRATIGHPVADDICARVHALAEDDPGAPAIRRGTHLITRGALLSRVGDLIEKLSDLRPGSVVAVLADPGPDLLAAWLAALWRGSAFLPLASTEPRLRIERALRDSAACAVLTGSDAPEFTAPGGCRTIACGDAAPTGHAPGPPDPRHFGLTGYLLRTSGSTGTPKLVSVSRGSLSNYLNWVAEDVLEDGADLPVVSPPVFDASFKQLLGPIYAGCCTWLLQADPTDPVQVHAELAESGRPLVINCVPSYWAELLVADGRSARRLAVRKLLLGGEPLSEALLKRTAEVYPGTEVWNLYGPTETTATATAGHVVPGQPVHVGTAVAGAFVAVTDTSGRVLPRLMRGEVWIAGPGRAEGYLGDADESAFTHLRLGELAVPAYRTGDVGLMDEHGRLRLAGRLDEQLKVRGWRIEPEEIERIAETTAGVVNAAVVLDDRAESSLLRLFFLGEAKEAAVLDVLRACLPTPMMPASATRVERLPRTGSGKLDRRALLGTAPAAPVISPSHYEPLELEIATVWRELIGCGWPDADEDFFTSGGHSLLLARLVNQLRTQGHQSLSLRQVVRNPSVNSIAALIRATEAS